MTDPSIPLTPEQRQIKLEACIVASLATGSKSHRDIRGFVQQQPGFDWANVAMIHETTNKMLHRKRIVRVWRRMRTIPECALPDPAPPAPLDRSVEAEMQRVRMRDIRILATIDWPKFFRIPREGDLLPTVKTRTGYDVRVDYNRF